MVEAAGVEPCYIGRAVLPKRGVRGGYPPGVVPRKELLGFVLQAKLRGGRSKNQWLPTLVFAIRGIQDPGDSHQGTRRLLAEFRCVGHWMITSLQRKKGDLPKLQDALLS
jgi:hypothetical protein